MLEDELVKKTIPQTMCRLRWDYPLVDFSRNEVRTCCKTFGQKISESDIELLGTDVFLNTDYQKQRRYEMIKGYRHSSCDQCWKMEDSGMTSLRNVNSYLPNGWQDYENDTIDVQGLNEESKILNLNNEDVLPIKDIDIKSRFLRSDSPFMLEINLSNTCDLQCTYCSPYFSSKWEGDLDLFSLGTGNYNVTEKQKSYIQEEVKKTHSEKFWETFWEWLNGNPIKSLTRVGVIGGEPIINRRFPEFIDRLIESFENVDYNGRASCGYKDEDGIFYDDGKPLFWIVTNLNTPPKLMDKFINEQLPKISQYFHFEIHASLEGIGSRIEYTRNGLSWERFKENAERLCALKLDNFDFGFQVAINSLSISSMPDFIRFARYLHDKYERGIILKQNMVVEPEFHHPAILPPEFSCYVDEAICLLEDWKDSARHVNDEWGTWENYYNYLITIRDSILKSNNKNIDWKNGSLEAVKKLFFDYFSEYDKKYEKDFLSTFPEYRGFYNHCKEISESLNFEKSK